MFFFIRLPVSTLILVKKKVKTHLPVSVAMAGSSEGGTAESGRARALNSTPAHSARANNVATFTPSVLPYPKQIQLIT